MQRKINKSFPAAELLFLLLKPQIEKYRSIHAPEDLITAKALANRLNKGNLFTFSIQNLDVELIFWIILKFLWLIIELNSEISFSMFKLKISKSVSFFLPLLYQKNEKN